MNHLSRSLADLICLWRDLLTQPREVLLSRNHRQWVGAGVIAVVAALVGFGVPGLDAGALVPTVVLAGPGFLLDLLGSITHGLWQSGRIWQDIECKCCGGPGGGGDDDDFDDPEDDGGLARDVEDWLKNQPTSTR